MDKKIYDALRDWLEAKKAAEPNAELITKSNFDLKVMHECAERMRTLDARLQALYELESRKDLPNELAVFLRSRHDISCGCLCSSSISGQHVDCRRKLNHFFRSQESLMRYVAALLTE
jgi:hypothetical protein